MKVQKCACPILLVSCLFVGISTVRSAIIVQHLGDADPTTKGWTHQTLGVGVTVGPLSPDTDPDSTFAWMVNDNITGANNGTYDRALTAQEATDLATSGWELTAKVRVVSNQRDGEISWGYFTGSTRFLVDFDDSDLNGTVAVMMFGVGVVHTTTGNASVYHDYKMIFDPASSTVDLFVDGVEVLSDFAGQANATPASVRWGAFAGNRIGHGNWAEVTLTLVPEPASAILLIGGLIAVTVGHRWQHRAARS